MICAHCRQTELTPRINNRHHTLTTAAERADDIVEVEVAKSSNIRSNEKTVATASVVTVMNVRVQYLSNSFGKRTSYTKTVQVVPLCTWTLETWSLKSDPNVTHCPLAGKMSTQLPWKLFDVQNSTAAALCSASVKSFAYSIEKETYSLESSSIARRSGEQERRDGEECL